MTRNETPPDQNGGSGQWLKSNLSALGSATVFAVYAAGFIRTKAAAASLSAEPVRRVQAVTLAPPSQLSAPAVPTAVPSVAPSVAPSVEPSAVTAPAQRVLSAVVPTPATHRTVAPVTAAPPAAVASAPAGTVAATVAAPTAAAKVATAQPSVPAVPAAKIPAATVAANVAPPIMSAPTAAPLKAAPVTTPVPAAPAPTPAPAPAPTTATAAAPSPADSAPARVGFKDGTFVGYGRSRHGDVETTVDIVDGQIVDAYITKCLTEYSCSWIVALPPEVVQRQSAEVDIVSGATASSNAFYAAVKQALAKAK